MCKAVEEYGNKKRQEGIEEGRKEGLQKGLKEGLQKGRIEGVLESVIKTIKKGLLTNEQIAENFDISLEEVQRLASQIS